MEVCHLALIQGHEAFRGCGVRNPDLKKQVSYIIMTRWGAAHFNELFVLNTIHIYTYIVCSQRQN